MPQPLVLLLPVKCIKLTFGLKPEKYIIHGVDIAMILKECQKLGIMSQYLYTLSRVLTVSGLNIEFSTFLSLELLIMMFWI